MSDKSQLVKTLKYAAAKILYAFGIVLDYSGKVVTAVGTEIAKISDEITDIRK